MAASAGLTRAIRRAADGLSGASGTAGERVAYRVGAVTTVTAGAAADGNAAVTVTVHGNAVPAPYAAAYTPTVSDLVMVLFIGGSPFIIGKLIGFPVV